MCHGCSETALTFWVRCTRMLSLSTTLASSHQSSLCFSSCLLVEIRIFFCFILTESFFSLTYSPPLSSCLLCGEKKKDDFFLSTSLLYCQSLPSSVEWPLALSCLNCCSSSQDVSEIKFSGAHSVSFVSSLFAWEGAMGIYSTAVVVMVTGEERGSAWTFLCWNFVLFFSFFPMYFRRNSLGWEGKLKVI